MLDLRNDSDRLTIIRFFLYLLIEDLDDIKKLQVIFPDGNLDFDKRLLLDNILEIIQIKNIIIKKIFNNLSLLFSNKNNQLTNDFNNFYNNIVLLKENYLDPLNEDNIRKVMFDLLKLLNPELELEGIGKINTIQQLLENKNKIKDLILDYEISDLVREMNVIVSILSNNYILKISELEIEINKYESENLAKNENLLKNIKNQKIILENNYNILLKKFSLSNSFEIQNTSRPKSISILPISQFEISKNRKIKIGKIDYQEYQEYQQNQNRLRILVETTRNFNHIKYIEQNNIKNNQEVAKAPAKPPRIQYNQQHLTHQQRLKQQQQNQQDGVGRE